MLGRMVKLFAKNKKKYLFFQLSNTQEPGKNIRTILRKHANRQRHHCDLGRKL
jgi:hypothetical protein